MNTVNKYIEKTNQTTVNSKYIDSGITSIKVGETDRGSIWLRIDKLSFVSSAVKSKANEDDLGIELGRLKGDKVMLVQRYSGEARHYCKTVVISFKNKPEAKLRIEYRPLNREKRAYIRFELSPQHFGPDRLTQMIEWLAGEGRLRKRLYRVLAAAWVTRIDTALDLENYQLSDFHLLLGGVQGASCAYRKYDDGQLGCYLGSIYSSFSILAYNKAKDAGTGKDKELDAGSYAFGIKGHQKFVRIESRIRPPKKHLMLDSLRSMSQDHWKRLTLYSRYLEDNSQLPGSFINDVKSMPIKAALDQLPGDKKQRRNSKARILRAMERYKLTLFDHELFYTCWFDCMQEMGILANPVTWQKVFKK